MPTTSWMLSSWQRADIAAHERFGGDFQAALRSIRARALVMPSATDLYSPPEDSALEVAGLRDAQLRVIPSQWGHHSGPPGLNPPDVDFIDAALKQFLA